MADAVMMSQTENSTGVFNKHTSDSTPPVIWTAPSLCTLQRSLQHKLQKSDVVQCGFPFWLLFGFCVFSREAALLQPFKRIPRLELECEQNRRGGSLGFTCASQTC